MGGLASTVGGLIGGNAGSSSAGQAVTNPYNQFLTQNTANWQGLSNSNLGNDQYLQSLMPQIQGLFSQQFSNPYASQLQTGANQAGSALQGVGNTGVANSGNLSTAGNSLLGGANSALGASFDPQSIMYNQGKQGALDQANVSNDQYGLEGPYAANATNQAMQNFNSNWSNQQLQRMLVGLQGAGGATSQGGSALTGASNLGAGGANNIYTGGAMPFGAANTVTGGQQNAFSNLFGNVGGVNGQNSNEMNSLLQFIQNGLGQQINRFNAQQQGAASGAQGGEDIGNLLGSAGLSQLGTSMGGGGGGLSALMAAFA